MKIEDYSFGKITIDGKNYISDVIIYPERVDSSWWRKEGHCLDIDDLKDVIDVKPEILVVGTGAYGAMIIPRRTEDYLKAKGIRLIAQKTDEAVRTFNELSGSARVVAALHLTC